MIRREHKLLFSETGATFSDCENYRYQLWRKWDNDGYCNFVLLNPSTADEKISDPTVTRCETRARAMGFGGLIVTNIFAFRATDPKVMIAQEDPIGPDNDEAILEAAGRSKIIILGYGEHGELLGRGRQVCQMLLDLHRDKLHALDLNKSGHPKHPLYVDYSQQPIPFSYGAV